MNVIKKETVFRTTGLSTLLGFSCRRFWDNAWNQIYSPCTGYVENLKMIPSFQCHLLVVWPGVLSDETPMNEARHILIQPFRGLPIGKLNEGIEADLLELNLPSIHLELFWLNSVKGF